MTAKTAPPKRKGGAKKGKNPPRNKTVERDGGLIRVYARLKPDIKAIIDQAAADDERSTMKYIERLLTKHAEQLAAKQKGK